ncbi:hypothetical protein PPYR_11532 [Photinus pyralis]|uniref:Sphingomyelin phosphodiesterase 4 n=2 Tax=Photinus pyralis TaxID=7054 RepID=A0A1Y1LXI8_PHOPY|nr:sphingomyelin phosphodiesterase 4 [Photinus pyralis]KAB0794693.1 hypothetical protein PPYR_11532 [Photinus pyralis]
MFYPQQESFMANFGEALLKNIDERCGELAVFIDRANLKDLHSIYPMLIDSIFGPLSKECWNLRGITESNSLRTYNAVRQFLSPLGPIFKLIYTLLKDPLVKFNFNLNYLPMKVRENTNPSTTHPFYMDMINVDLQTNQTVSLMLNPFDYYFFHFAYHLINPIHFGQSSDTVHWETVYFTLYCDYLRHYLPNDPSTKILPNLNFYHGKNPYYTLPSLNKPAKVSKLLRADLFNVNTVESVQHHPRNEVWRSETVMTVFIDMWFGSDRLLNSSYNFDSNFSTAFKDMFQRNEMPSTEYIRIVRVLVKHLHAFANSARADDTHLGDLKRIVIPCLQGKIYVLLRHLIYSWPLDGSFRLVLELWFSFIQPWRYLPDYLKLNQVDANIDNEDLNTSTSGVTRDHMTFLAENLLAYTVLLQQLLPRFNKVDLASPKIALILYRTCKVFGQPHLISYLRDIEEAIQQVTVTSPIHPYHSPTSHGLPPLSPTSKWSTNNSQYSDTQIHWKDTVNSSQTPYGGFGGKWGNIVRQRILEYEGSHFCYKPMFIPPVASEVLELISHIQNAQRVALNNVQMHVREKEQRGFFLSLISKLNINEYLHNDYNEEDRKKVPIYLDYSLKLLVEMFQITEYVTPQTSFDTVPLKSGEGPLSNPRQLMARIKKIKYEGDPDLRPIQSHEVKALVRMLYRLSVKVNSKYGSEMRDWYNTNTWLGFFLRQILCPPLRIYTFDKSSPGAPKRVSEDLPPRISLRFLANFWVIFYSILIILLTKFFGFSLLALFFIIFVLWCTYSLIKSVYEPYPNDRNIDASMSSSMSREFYNNDSF